MIRIVLLATFLGMAMFVPAHAAEPLVTDNNIQRLVVSALSERTKQIEAGLRNPPTPSALRKLRESYALKQLVVYLDKRWASSITAAVLLAELYMQLQMSDSANTVIDTIAKSTDPLAVRELERLRAENKVLTVHFQPSIEMLTRYLKKNADGEGFAYLSCALIRDGKFDLARRANERALELRPELDLIVRNKVMILKRSGPLDQSAAEFRRYLKRAPDDMSALIDFMAVLLQQKKEKEAVSECARILRQSENDAQVLEMVGQGYASNENPRKAIEFLSQSIKVDPSRPSAIYARSTQFSKVMLFDLAMEDCKRILSVAPTSSGFHWLAQDQLKRCMRGKKENRSVWYTFLE